MYDIPTKAVSKLSGELSSSFVKVAESNASAQDLESVAITDSGIIEQMPNKIQTTEETTTIPSSAEKDMDMDMEDSDAEGSEHLETVVKYEPVPVPDAKAKPSFENKVMISSGYSVIKS